MVLYSNKRTNRRTNIIDMKAPKIFKVLNTITLASFIFIAAISLWRAFNATEELQIAYIMSYLGWWTCATVWIVAYMNKN